MSAKSAISAIRSAAEAGHRCKTFIINYLEISDFSGDQPNIAASRCLRAERSEIGLGLGDARQQSCDPGSAFLTHTARIFSTTEAREQHLPLYAI